MEKGTKPDAIRSVGEEHMATVDNAFQYLKEHHVEPLSEADDRRILRKIDRHLLPMMIVTYTLNFMDKNALSYSASFGLTDDNHLHGNQYSWASGSVFYLAYMVSQPVVARLIVRFPVGRFVACATILWGATLMTMAASRSFAALMSIRAILGCLESCINPAFMIISAQWWKRDEQPLRITYWYLGNSIGQVCGGLLGYGIAHIQHHSVARWAWFFIIFGSITILYGIFLLYYLPDSPMNARWLSERDRALAIERVRSNRTSIENNVWKWSQFKECVLDVQCWILVATFFLDDVPAGGVGSFGSIVVKGFGFSALYSTLLLCPLGIIQAICVLFGGFMTSRFQNIRTWLIAGCQIPALIGAVLLYTLPRSNQRGLLGSYYVVQTHGIVGTLTMSLVTSNVAGYTKKVTASAMMYIAYCVGQVVGPQPFLANEAPVYETAFRAAFVCFALCITFSLALRLYLVRENKSRDRLAREQSATHETNDEFLDLTDKQQKMKRMKDIQWQLARPSGQHRAALGVQSWFLLPLGVFAVAASYLILAHWQFSHQRPTAATDLALLTRADLKYGTAQCTLNRQRPYVNHDLATERLARPRLGLRKVLRNATLINGDGTTTPNCTIEVQGRNFTRVCFPWRPSESGPEEEGGATVVELHGRIVTPGLIDMHSHAGVRETPQLWATEDVTEVSAPVTPWGRAIDGLKPHDQAIAFIGSGGVTTSLVLTGAKNLISGEGVVIKMRRADSARGLIVDMTSGNGTGKPQRFLKMAMGENQKRQFEHTSGGPATRLGESYWFRNAFGEARRVMRAQDRWCEAASTAAGRSRLAVEYPRSLQWQTLVDVMRGDVRVNVHGYETEDIYALLDHADEFGFNVTAFHHALHSDQILEELKSRNIAVVGFSDSWGDKKELYNVSSSFPKRIVDHGIPLALTRDHPAEHGQWLAYEAQIAHHFGLGANHALASVMAVPARLLGLDNRLGFIRPGYDADFVIWDRHPLRVGATPLEVYIDGSSQVRASDAAWHASNKRTAALSAPGARPTGDHAKNCRQGAADFVLYGIQRSYVGQDNMRSDMAEGHNLTAVFQNGKMVCLGGRRCDDRAKEAIEKRAAVINVRDGHILPGLTIVTRLHGLAEMHQEPSTTDGYSHGDIDGPVLKSRFGLRFGGIHLQRAHGGGVTRIVTPPLTSGFLHDVSCRFRSGARSAIDDDAITEPHTALHFSIGHEAKTSQLPSVTAQISALRNILTAGHGTHDVHGRAARGELPVVIHTNSKDVIAQMIALKRETAAHIVIMGGAEAHHLAPALAAANVPVIMAPFWGCEPLTWESRSCLPGPPLTESLGPTVLLQHGVEVAISNWDVTNNHIRNSAWEAGWVAGSGNTTLALDLVSRNIENILRLRPTTDVVVYEGDPFEFGARVAVIIEQGRIRSCYPSPDET
ncbi:ethylene receptor [Purpureocillium lavendulum]|uniref:Ethylene receptor n=1 Tax=Purpureocillium lavendulum TaxID=1247861 RepID=A0AB34FK49_9HYPO|nr:ethylene receptor [Purpureocillium lavendulum]